MASIYRQVLNLISDDLAARGVVVEDVTKLSADQTPVTAVPVLLDWIYRLRTYDLDARSHNFLLESIVHTLTGRAARKQAMPTLLALFRDPELPTLTRWSVGSALELAADETVLDDLLDLAEDRRFGAARQMVVYSLGRIGKARRRNEVVRRLTALLDDAEVRGHAIEALMRLRGREALPEIARYIDDEGKYIRDMARKAVKKLS